MKQDYTDLFLNGKITVTLICWIRFNSINPHIVYDYLRCSLADRYYTPMLTYCFQNFTSINYSLSFSYILYWNVCFFFLVNKGEFIFVYPWCLTTMLGAFPPTIFSEAIFWMNLKPACLLAVQFSSFPSWLIAMFFGTLPLPTVNQYWMYEYTTVW